VKSDPKRTVGFYWVRFEGEVIVGEYTDTCSRHPHWHFTGSPSCYADSEVCELLSSRLRFIANQTKRQDSRKEVPCERILRQ
jgi:hypothetical protein